MFGFLTVFIVLSTIQYNSESFQGTYDFLFAEYLERDLNRRDDKFDSYNNPTDIEKFPDICNDFNSEICATNWLDEVQKVYIRNANRISNIYFKFKIDINEKNKMALKKIQSETIPLNHDLFKKARKFKWHKFKNPTIKRIFQLITPTVESKNVSISLKISEISRDISVAYDTANPSYKGKKLGEGENGIEKLFKIEKDYDTLAGYWASWRDIIGPKIRNDYIHRRNLKIQASQDRGIPDPKKYTVDISYDQKNFNETVMKLYDEIFPFYQQIHAYVRYCLWKYYPKRFDKNGPIPAHILGNVWAQNWQNIFPIIKKCRGSTGQSLSMEIDQNLSKLTVKQMFKMSEKFFESIGMYKMLDNFWTRSMLEKPKDKIVDCHGSAADLAIGTDYRIKMCTSKEINDFTTIHHEMGHVEYYMAYKKLPYFLRGGANSGFHEAVGDTIALSVKTPEHLKEIGLIKEIPSNPDFDIDYLMERALEKVAFLPFALTMETYSWGVFNKSIKDENLNEEWWKMRMRFQGLMSPVPRTEKHFDAGAKYHFARDISYLRYFVSFISQFQFYEAMCVEAGKYSANSSLPLHRCDFYNSKKAGEKFLNMLKQGRKKPWQETMPMLIGKSDSKDIISTKSLLKYFKPLHDWLIKTNKKLGIPVGW